MSKHTPGPWAVEFGEGAPAGTYRLVNFDAARTYQARGLDAIYEEERANAALIAEAPAMYEALRGLLEPCGICDYGVISTCECDQRRAAAVSTLSRIEGTAVAS